MGTWAVGDIEITRVADPGWELVLPQDEATVAVLTQAPWLQPHFVTPDWALRIGSSAIVIRTPEHLVLVDPFLAFDDPERLGPRLDALRDAGVEAGDVDALVLSHIDGLGASFLLDGEPTFPRARYLVPDAELAAIAAGTHPEPPSKPLEGLLALDGRGGVERVAGDEEVVAGVRLEDAPGHNPGQVVVWVGAGDAGSAVVVGHLFLHPAQIAAPEVDNGDLDPAALAETRRRLLSRCERDGSLLVGPLFESPGAGAVIAHGGTWALVV